MHQVDNNKLSICSCPSTTSTYAVIFNVTETGPWDKLPEGPVYRMGQGGDREEERGRGRGRREEGGGEEGGEEGRGAGTGEEWSLSYEHS